VESDGDRSFCESESLRNLGMAEILQVQGDNLPLGQGKVFESEKELFPE
jgi:hypothetical protein